MDEDNLPTVSPTEAAIVFAYARLVVLLDRAGVIGAETIAADLEDHADAIPEQARSLLLNIARSLRPPASRLSIVPDAE